MSDCIETIRDADVGDVSVRKTIETGDEDRATVTLEVTADREAPLVVRLAEPALAAIPDDEVDLEEVGGAGDWQLDDGGTFARRFDGGESASLVYRVRNVDEERFRRLDVDPEVSVETDVPAALDDVVDREGSEAVRRLIEGRADSLSVEEIDDGADASDTDGRPQVAPETRPSADSAAAEPADSAEGAAGGEAQTADGASAGDGDAPEDVADGPEGLADAPGGVAEALLAELSAGEVDDAVAGELREELNVGRSQDVRIRHLQRQVSDLAAYADMLETFVDDHGTLEEVVGELLADVEGVDGSVATLRDDLEELSTSVTAEVDELHGDVTTLADGRADVEDRLGAIERELETLDERLEELEAFADRLSGAFQSVDGGNGDGDR